MTTTPDTVNVTEAAATSDEATAPAGPAPGGTVGGAARTERRAPRPDLEEEPSSAVQRFLVGLFVAVPLAALIAAIPLAWGWGFLGWHDVVIALVFYWVSGLGITVGFHRYFTHGSFKAKTGAAHRARRRRQPGHRGTGHHLGGRPPPAPQVHRQGGRPALAVALRGRLEGADQGPGVRAHRLAVRPRTDLAGEVLARPAGRPATSSAWIALFPALVAVSLLLPALIGGLWRHVLARRADRLLLGQPGPRRAAAPRHLVDQLDLPRVRQRGRSRSATGRATSGLAGDPVVRRVLAQPAPRRPDVRPARRAAGPDRLRAPGSSGRSRSSAGPTTSAGPTRTGSRPSVPPPRPGNSAR